MARVQTVLSEGATPGAPARPGKHRAPSGGAPPAAPAARPVRRKPAATADSPPVPPPRHSETDGLSQFTRYALQQIAQFPDRTVTLLQAGCTTAGAELDMAALRASHQDLDISLIDAETPVTQAVVAAWPELESATLGDLRLIPVRPRSYDIVHCPFLLHRISHADVVLGRLAAALRPGGLMLLRIADPTSATGFLDRTMPASLREAAWRTNWPGLPGPHPAVYETVASPAGIEAFVSRHGLSIAHRAPAGQAGRAVRGGQPRPAARLVSWLSGGRLPCDHDQLCYVIRKPEDRFARVLP